MTRYIGAYRGGVRPSAPTTVYRTCALSFPCHSEPVTDVTGVGIRSPFHINGGLGRHLLCRSAAKARFDNRQPPKGVSKEGGPQPSLFGRSRMGDFQGGRKIEGGRVTAPPPAGLIQIVANGHTAFTGGTRGRRAGTRSVRGPLAGRRAGRGHDRRPAVLTAAPPKERRATNNVRDAADTFPPSLILVGGGESKGASPASDRAGAPRRHAAGTPEIK